MGSSRLPGKTLMEVREGLPLLALVVRRFRLCREVDEVCVATTDQEADDAIEKWCAENGVRCFRGSEDDICDRVTKTGIHAGADAIVQMGADSAYLDFRLIDELVRIYRDGDFDYVCNDMVRTYPLGIYGHVVRTSTLAAVNARDDLSFQDRDDVVRYIFERPEQYRIHNLTAAVDMCPELRFTIDYPEDMQLLREILDELGGRLDYTTADLLELYRRKGHLFEKTRNLVQRSAPFMKKIVNA